MTIIARLFFRLARFIAGRARHEWIDAMAAEAATLDRSDLGWSFGCLLAAASDRFRRERMSLGLIIATPLVIYGVEMITFFGTALLFRQSLVPQETIYVAAIASALPFVWLLGRWCPHMALRAAFLSFVLASILPGLIFAAKFGTSPWLFFADGATLMGMPVKIGLLVKLVLWLSVAEAGRRFRRNGQDTHTV